jgi:hypothetical protein
MKYLLPILGWLLPAIALSQAKDSAINKMAANLDSNAINKELFAQQTAKPEILSGGFIDIVQNGQMSASARLFRLFIGEPGKFQIPVSLFAGVSANSLSAINQNNEFAVDLINPGAGIFNFSFDGDNKLIYLKGRVTSFHVQYQAGFRMLTAFAETQQKNIRFFNGITGLGLTFVTGVWEKNKADNLGVFWFNLRGLYSSSPSWLLKQLLAATVAQNMLGYSAGMGIEISQSVNTRIFYFKFLTDTAIPAFAVPYLQLSFNYSMH